MQIARSSRLIWFLLASIAAGVMAFVNFVIFPQIGWNDQPISFSEISYHTFLGPSYYKPFCRILSLILIPAGLFYIGLLPKCHRTGPYPERIVRLMCIVGCLPAILAFFWDGTAAAGKILTNRPEAPIEEAKSPIRAHFINKSKRKTNESLQRQSSDSR